jgi:hypothetical protein
VPGVGVEPVTRLNPCKLLIPRSCGSSFQLVFRPVLALGLPGTKGISCRVSASTLRCFNTSILCCAGPFGPSL